MGLAGFDWEGLLLQLLELFLEPLDTQDRCAPPAAAKGLCECREALQAI